MTVLVVRMPDPKNTASFVLAVAEARAAALEAGRCLLVGKSMSDAAYLCNNEGEWHMEPATLLDQPAWTAQVLRLITRHGR